MFRRLHPSRFNRHSLGYRMPIGFSHSKPERIPIRMGSLRIPPLNALVVSSDSTRLDLVAGLFGGAGHQAIRVLHDGVGLKLIWPTPDLVLVDSALPETEREALRLQVTQCTARTCIPMLEFSESSFQVTGDILRVNGYPIPFGQKGRQRSGRILDCPKNGGGNDTADQRRAMRQAAKGRDGSK